MKIIYKIGDVTEASETIIAHGCNSHGVMGSGVARHIREKYPKAFLVYRTQYQLYGLYLGQVVYSEEDKIIANCITQKNYGNTGNVYVDYDAIKTCMENLYSYAGRLGYNAVAMPKIGAGLGGGDWSIISKIIEDIFVDIQPVVYIYEG
jgi:O-acetyl-ADP-ribose deacetylase (regulator of RNase III)